MATFPSPSIEEPTEGTEEPPDRSLPHRHGTTISRRPGALTRIRQQQVTRYWAGRRGGSSPKYEDWSKQELYDKAKKVDVEGRSKMSKSELVDALRSGM